MDVEQKKQDTKEDIARGPETIVYARIKICDAVQLADEMKAQFTSYFRQAANTAVGASNTNTLHEVCINLAKQRALLHGANVGTIMGFNIGGLTPVSGSYDTAIYTATGGLTFPLREDSSQGNKTTLPFIVLHDLNEDGGTVTLSTTTNANTTIADDEGNNVKYFTDFSKYFMTRSRANGELISVDENSAPYTSPSAPEPFLPLNTINGEKFVAPASNPTVNSDVRYEYSLVANTEPIAGGHVGGGYDLAEDYYTGNTFVVMEATNVVGTFTSSETITDSANNTATVKSSANTTTVLLETTDAVGTFVSGELLTDRGTNAAVFSINTGSNTQIDLTLTGSTFLTGSDANVELGFILSNTISLDSNTVTRVGSTVTVQTANAHGINSGERIVLKGADDAFDEFNGVFIVQDTTANTLTFITANTGTVIPTGSFQIMNNVIYGRTSNAAAAIRARTVNASANIVFQSSNLEVGFAIANTFTGSSGGATGKIETRIITGEWYQERDNEVKVFNTSAGTWTIDAAANTGEFWNKNFEPVRISTIIPTTGSGSSTIANKMVLTKAIATSGDTTGGYDSTAETKLPGFYLAYPLKTWADQVHDGVTTLEAYENFANVINAPEGLEVNFDWLPLGLGNTGADLNQNGTVQTAVYNAENVTTINKTDFQGKLGPYSSALSSPQDDVYRSVNGDLRSNAIKVGTSGAVYPYVNANPFFPAVNGSQKPIANTSDGITGTQPGGLGANAIYAGTYTEVQTGALDPPPQTDPQTIVMNNRFIIQNDLKWIYSSNPFDANTSAGGSSTYNAPQTAAYQSTFDGSLDGEIGAVSSQSADGTSGSVVVTIPADVAGTCTANSHVNTGVTQTTYTTGTVGSHANMVRVVIETCTDLSSCSISQYTTAGACTGAEPAGNWTSAWGFVTTTDGEFANFFNRVQYVMTSAGGALTVGSTGGMETNFAIFYQLVLNLTSASYGKNYTDPVQQTAAGSYTNIGRSDANFKTVVETMKSRVDAVISLHNTERGLIVTAMAGSSSYPITANYKTAYDSMISYLADFKQAVIHRITEISNRIGYLNGKNTASGGGSFVAGASVVDYLLLDNTDISAPPTVDAGDNVLHEDADLVQLESAVSEAVAVGSAGDGFTGYSFNSGSGYANTIFAHANFLAGKKINLLGEILTAIADVDSVYDIITSNRSKYYEYNQ